MKWVHRGGRKSAHRDFHHLMSSVHGVIILKRNTELTTGPGQAGQNVKLDDWSWPKTGDLKRVAGVG
jgi:hypothetical protein